MNSYILGSTIKAIFLVKLVIIDLTQYEVHYNTNFQWFREVNRLTLSSFYTAANYLTHLTKMLSQISIYTF